MATETELYADILKNMGVDCDSLPDNMITTLLKAIAQNCGGGGGGSAGGGSDDGILRLYLNYNDMTYNVPYENVISAINNGTPIVAIAFGNEPPYGAEVNFIQEVYRPKNADYFLARNIHFEIGAIESGDLVTEVYTYDMKCLPDGTFAFLEN